MEVTAASSHNDHLYQEFLKKVNDKVENIQQAYRDIAEATPKARELALPERDQGSGFSRYV